MTQIKKILEEKKSGLQEGWREVCLGDVGKVVTGKTPSKNNPEDWYGNVDFITPTDIKTDSKNIFKTSRTISEKGQDRFSNMILPENAVIVTCIGSDMGKVVINKNKALTNQQINSLIVSNDFDYNFIYYLLKNSYKILRQNAEGGGSTMPIINKSSFENLKSFIPENIETQKSIAKILSSFDEKIELLREENETLEKIGQEVFKEWFGGYKVGSELPEGWRVGKITEIINRLSISYKCIKTDLDKKGKTPILDQGTNGLYGYTSREPDFFASKENPVVVFTNHTCNYWFIDYSFCAIQNVIPYCGKDGYDEYFLYFMTKGSIQFIEYKGHWPDFEAKDFIIPTPEKAGEFSKLAKPILEKISDNNSQIQELGKTRDELLPKLMKGEVLVEEEF